MKNESHIVSSKENYFIHNNCARLSKIISTKVLRPKLSQPRIATLLNLFGCNFMAQRYFSGFEMPFHGDLANV